MYMKDNKKFELFVCLKRGLIKGDVLFLSNFILHTNNLDSQWVKPSLNIIKLLLIKPISHFEVTSTPTKQGKQ